MIYSIIGSNYGDEGKGLATDYLVAKSKRPLVIRHNGGAQAGHTVDFKESKDVTKRFVFHEISSGSFRNCDTYWAETFCPDLYKLRDELETFKKESGFSIRVFSSPKTKITLIFDVLLNMLSETLRGDNRHGSCGMGIWEAYLRNKAGFGIEIGDLIDISLSDFIDKLAAIRRDYVMPRCREIISDIGVRMNDETNEIYELLCSEDVLENFSKVVLDNVNLVTLRDFTKEFLGKYEDVIFEGAQGLCLDFDYKASLPHVTASKTGLTNPVMLLGKIGLNLDEVVYITRSYLTKHGAGPLLVDENLTDLLENKDLTNVFNPWQGSIRYASFESPDWILNNIQADLRILPKDFETTVSVMVTHLNETDNKVCFRDGLMVISEFKSTLLKSQKINKFYLSATKFSDDIIE